jgi:hypothetical protein
VGLAKGLEPSGFSMSSRCVVFSSSPSTESTMSSASQSIRQTWNFASQSSTPNDDTARLAESQRATSARWPAGDVGVERPP